MQNIDGILDLPTIGANGRPLTLNFGGGKAPAPPKPPKIQIPEMPKFKFPEYTPPEPPPTPPPIPVQVTTNDTQSAADDARIAAYRKKGTAATLFAGAAGNKSQASVLGGTGYGTKMLG